MSGNRIVIFANGRSLQVESGVTVQSFLESKKINPRSVMVEINGEALLRDEFDNRQFSHGDRVEVVRVVAGG